jgi:hypothetical protein
MTGCFMDKLEKNVEISQPGSLNKIRLFSGFLFSEPENQG